VFHELRVPLNTVTMAVGELCTMLADLPAAASELIDVSSVQVCGPNLKETPLSETI
jgi:hypothetical protein